MRANFLLSFSTIILVSLLLFSPVYGQNPNYGIVGCGNNCDWGQLIQLGQNIIGYLVLIAGSLAAISFAYAGWLYLTSGGDPSKVTKAKDIFVKVAIGLIVVLCAWLIVHEVLKLLGVNQNYSLIKTS